MASSASTAGEFKSAAITKEWGSMQSEGSASIKGSADSDKSLRLVGNITSGSNTGSHQNSRSEKVSAPGPISVWIRSLARVFEPVWHYFQRAFTIPLVRDPISYCRVEDFTPTGDRIYKLNKEEEQTLDMIEAACNYNEATRALFEKIILDRKENALNKKEMAAALDFSRLAPWNDSMLDRLQCIFQIFDSSGDGNVTFDEMSNMMTEHGDTSSVEDRRKVFSAADSLGKGYLNFREFVTMMHYITVKAPDATPQPIVDTFRQIERNMARIRSLDVVQQLQAGLF